MMNADLEEVLISVWRQTLLENAKAVRLHELTYPVQRTSRSQLRQVDFDFGGQRLRGLEQNPATSSNWARRAREGKKVMQFLIGGRYFAVVVDGRAHFYEHH
jgi:hypothetical protein